MIELDSITMELPGELAIATPAAPYIDRVLERDAPAQLHDVLFALAIAAIAALLVFALVG
jgi:hypothetical protein